MKEHLAGKQHADDEDLQHPVVDWLNSQLAVWFEEGINKLKLMKFMYHLLSYSLKKSEYCNFMAKYITTENL